MNGCGCVFILFLKIGCGLDVFCKSVFFNIYFIWSYGKGRFMKWYIVGKDSK